MKLFDSKESTSYNSRESLSLREFFIPSWSQNFLYILVGLLTLVLANAHAIWSLFSNTYLSEASFNEFINQSAPGISAHLGKLQAGRLPLFVLWGLIGSSVYIILWFIGTTANNIRNDLIADSYFHPIDNKRREFWKSVLGQKAFLVLLLIMLIAYVYAFLRFLNAISNFFYSAIAHFKLTTSVAEILLSVFATAVLIYVLIIVTHLVYNSFKDINRNF